MLLRSPSCPILSQSFHKIRTGGLGVLENGLLVVASVRGVHDGRWIFLEGNSTKGNEPIFKSRGADNVEKGLGDDVNNVVAQKRTGEEGCLRVTNWKRELSQK